MIRKNKKMEEKMKNAKYVFYKFKNSSDVHKARFLNKCRKKLKGLNYVKILPLTEIRGVCNIPENCVIKWSN